MTRAQIRLVRCLSITVSMRGVDGGSSESAVVPSASIFCISGNASANRLRLAGRSLSGDLVPPPARSIAARVSARFGSGGYGAPIVLLRNNRQAGLGLVEYSVAKLDRSDRSAATATTKGTMTFSGFIALKSGLERFNRYYRAKSYHKQNTLREFSRSSRGAGSIHSIPTPIIVGDEIG